MATSPTTITDDRFLALAATTNTRDLGGVPLASGGVTHSGQFYRSDIPMNLTPADMDVLRGAGVRTVIDLRQPVELERDPNSLASVDGIDYRNIMVWGHIEGAGEEPEDKYDITAFYIAALDHSRPAFHEVMSVLAAAEGAALFHCTAGKDRTGLVSALLLEAVGVSRQAVLDDFALTHDRIESLRRRLLAEATERGEDPAQFARLLGATPDLLVPALDHLEDAYGGAEAYLLGSGVSASTLGALRGKLLG